MTIRWPSRLNAALLSFVKTVEPVDTFEKDTNRRTGPVVVELTGDSYAELSDLNVEVNAGDLLRESDRRMYANKLERRANR